MKIRALIASRFKKPIATSISTAVGAVADRFRAAHGGKLVTHQAISTYEEFFDNLIRVDSDESLAKIGMSRHRLEMLLDDDEIDEKVERRLEHLTQAEYVLSPSEGKSAVFCDSHLDRLITKILTASMNAKLYGYSVCELIWRSTEMDKVNVIRQLNVLLGEYDTTYIYGNRSITEEEYHQLFLKGERYIDDVVEKPMEWFEPKNDGRLLWFPDGNQKGIEVDTKVKYLLQQHRPTYKNPRGKALLSRVYWLWYFKKNGWTFWSKFLERFGSPLLIGMTKGDPDEMAEALAAAHDQSIFTMVEGDTVDTIGAMGNGETFKAYDDAINRRISKYLLGQTLVSGTDSGGTFGQGRTHQDQQEIVFTSDKQFATPYIQRVLTTACQMNGYEHPTFQFRVKRGAQTDLAQRDMLLVNQGLELDVSYYVDTYDINAKYVKGVNLPSRIPQTKIDTSASANGLPNISAVSAEQQELENLMDLGVEGGVQPIDTAAIMNVIKTTARADLNAALFAMVGNKLDENDFTQFMASVAMVADIHGMVDETLGN